MRLLAELFADAELSADFHATRSAQWWSGEFEVEATACPPGDGGIGWEVGLAEDA